MLTAQQRGPCSEIKIAVIGYVSVGKTTVLNALFRDRYSHVYMTPTTAAVNNFRISTSSSSKQKAPPRNDSQEPGKRKADTMEDEDEDDDEDEDMMVDADATTSPRTADSTLKEITADNAALRNSHTVQEKTFDIELQQDLCKMRPDTKLVLVDIPGINEAGASHKYRDYVTDHWHAFDCVVCVLDGTLGVNTEEQMGLLNLVKDNTTKIKDMPVIFLCNKVDEPEFDEPQVLVRAARQAVETIFQVGCREKALDAVLEKVTDVDSHLHTSGGQQQLFPVFIPISALRAFIYYQAASLKSRDEFHTTMDKDHILKLGKENVAGNKWRKLSEKEKLDKAFEVVSDPEQCREGLATSNFDKFLQVLSYSVGGEKTQVSILEKQIRVLTARLSPNVCLARELRIILERSNALGKPTNELKHMFWNLFKDCEAQAFERFKGPGHVASLADAMKQLTEYSVLVKEAGWDDEESVIKGRMKTMIRRQFGVLFEQAHEHSSFVDTDTVDMSSTEMTWESLPPGGWEVIFRSILMVANECVCYENFGREIVWLENFLHWTREQLGGAASSLSSSTTVCPLCKGHNMSHQHDALLCGSCGKYFNTKSNEGNCAYCKYRNNAVRPVGPDGRCNNSCGKTTPDPKSYKKSFPEYLKIKFVDGCLEPVDTVAYKRNVGDVDIPEGGPSNPAHYGHLLWNFCRIIKAVDQN
jgi:GTPase SAR1 family protein